MKYGYFRLSRKMFDGHDPLWKEDRVFSKAEAWIDMIQMAAYEEHTIVIGNDEIHIDRGEFLASIRFLAARWSWSRKKVECFIRTMKRLGRIRGHKSTTKGDTFILVNYGLYQGEGDRLGDTKETGWRQVGDKTNKGKERERKKRVYTQTEKNVWDRFAEIFTDVTGREVRSVTKKRMGTLNARLKDFSLDEIEDAVRAASKDSFLRGDNENGRDYLTPDYILRADKLELWLAKAREAKKPERDTWSEALSERWEETEEPL